MTSESLVAVMAVCLTLLAALILVLHHLKALHLTKSQAEDLRGMVASRLLTYGDEVRVSVNTINENQRTLSKDLDETKSKLSALSNRVR